MRSLWIVISFFYLINGRVTVPKICRNCLGKIHTRTELELTKHPLIVDKNYTCHHEQYKFVIIVKSSNFQRRNFTRHTWAAEIIEHFNIPVLYAVGYSPDTNINEEILREDELHHDLLQFPILESYYNLTLKTISILHWYNEYCSNSSTYLLYVDDDILIHVDRLMFYINEKNTSDAIEGWFETLGKIQRTGIGGISKENFPIDIVPDYLWGAAVLYPSKVIANALLPTIYNTSLPIFFRDDVFINGFIAQEAEVRRQALKDIVLYDKTENQLKNKMIVISFDTEEHRYRAWNCYRYETDCYRKSPIGWIIVVSSVFLISISGYLIWKHVRSIRFVQELKYELTLWYSGVTYSWRKHLGPRIGNSRVFRSISTIRCSLRFPRRNVTRIFAFLLISLVVCYLFKSI